MGINKLNELKEKLSEAKGTYKRIVSDIDKTKQTIDRNQKHLINCEKAQLIVQIVANETQSQLEYRLNELVTLAMQAIFQEDAYELNMQFDIKRGRTNASPLFVKNGKKRRPLFGSGFGMADVASFNLRPTLWSLEQQKKRPVFVYDEPFRHLNDGSFALHKRAVSMIKELSEKLNIQIIIITQNEALCEAGDIVYNVYQKNDISYIT